MILQDFPEVFRKTARKMESSFKNLLSKCVEIRNNLQICSPIVLKKCTNRGWPINFLGDFENVIAQWEINLFQNLENSLLTEYAIEIKFKHNLKKSLGTVRVGLLGSSLIS